MSKCAMETGKNVILAYIAHIGTDWNIGAHWSILQNIVTPDEGPHLPDAVCSHCSYVCTRMYVMQCHVWIQVSRLMAVLRRRISLAAKVLTWQRWHQSACRCHQDSLSPLRFARTSIRTTARTRKSLHIRRRLSNSLHFSTDWLRLVRSIKSGWFNLLANMHCKCPNVRILSHRPLISTDHFFWAFCLQVEEALQLVEKRTGRVFGDDTNPLLVSVRSGARASMPGDAMAVSWLLYHKKP